MSAKYRTRQVTSAPPVIVEAVRFGLDTGFDEIEKFVGGDAEFRSGKLVVATRQGALSAKSGDWIVKHDNGEFTSCSPDIFATLYEALP